MSLYADRIRQLEEEGNRLRKEISSLIDEANSPLTDASNVPSLNADPNIYPAKSALRPSAHVTTSVSHPLHVSDRPNGIPYYGNTNSSSSLSPEIDLVLAAELRRKNEIQSEIARQLGDFWTAHRGISNSDLATLSNTSLYALTQNGLSLSSSRKNDALASVSMPQFILEKELRSANERCALLTSRLHETAEKLDTERRALRSSIEELKVKLSASEKNRDELIESHRKETTQQEAAVARLQETLRSVSDASRAHQATLADTIRRLDETQQTNVVHDAVVRELRRMATDAERRRRSQKRETSPDLKCDGTDDLEGKSSVTRLLHFLDRTLVELTEELNAKEHAFAVNRAASERDANEHRERLTALQTQLDAVRFRDADAARVTSESAALLERIRQLEHDVESVTDRARSDSERLIREATRERQALLDELNALRANETVLNDRLTTLLHETDAERGALRLQHDQLNLDRRAIEVERERLATERALLEDERERLTTNTKRAVADAHDRARAFATRAKDARGDIEATRGELKRAQTLIVELETRLEAVRNDLETARQTIAATQIELRSRSDDLDAMRQERDSVTTELKASDCQLQNARLRLEQLQIETDYLRTLYSAKDGRAPLDISTIDIAAMTTQLFATDIPNQTRTKAIELVTALSYQLEDLRCHNHAVVQQLADCEQHVRELENELACAKAEASERQHTLETVRSAKQTVEHELERARRDGDRLKETYERNAAERERQERRLSEKFCSAVARSAELEASLKYTRNVVKRSRSVASRRSCSPNDKLYLRASDYRALNDQLRCKNKLLAEEVSSLNKECTRLRNEVNQLDAAFTDAQHAQETCRLRHTTAEDRVDSLRGQIAASSSELHRAAARIEELQTQVRRLESANAMLLGKHEIDMRELARLVTLSSPLPQSGGRLPSRTDTVHTDTSDEVARSVDTPQLEDLLFDLRSFVKSYEDSKASAAVHEIDQKAKLPCTPMPTVRHAGSFNSLNSLSRRNESEYRRDRNPVRSALAQTRPDPIGDKDSHSQSMSKWVLQAGDGERTTDGDDTYTNANFKRHTKKSGYVAKFVDDIVIINATESDSSPSSRYSTVSQSRSSITGPLVSAAPLSNRVSSRSN